MSKTAMVVNTVVTAAERRQKESTGLTWGQILRLGLQTARDQVAAADRAEEVSRAHHAG